MPGLNELELAGSEQNLRKIMVTMGNQTKFLHQNCPLIPIQTKIPIKSIILNKKKNSRKMVWSSNLYQEAWRYT
jgi:hypothetical protein